MVVPTTTSCCSDSRIRSGSRSTAFGVFWPCSTAAATWPSASSGPRICAATSLSLPTSAAGYDGSSSSPNTPPRTGCGAAPPPRWACCADSRAGRNRGLSSTSSRKPARWVPSGSPGPIWTWAPRRACRRRWRGRRLELGEGTALVKMDNAALVHDYLLVLRGAERSFAAMADCWPTAPIYTLLYDAGGTAGAFDDRRVITSPLQRLGARQGGFRRLLPFFPWAVERLPLQDHDLIVSSTSAFAHGVRPRAGAVHISYCYTPFRYAWHERER